MDGYFLTFETQGGRFENGNYQRFLPVDGDGKATPPPAPTRTGFSFVGWYKDSAYTAAWNFDADRVTQDISIYAKWERGTYIITFDAQNGTPNTTQTALYESYLTQPANPVREGYTFAGWYTETTYTNMWNFVTSLVPASYPTLYAKWVEVHIPTYTITFDVQGGSTVAQQTVALNEKVIQPANPTRSGYAFLGWYNNAAGTWYNEYVFTTAVTGNLTLYAKWEVAYTITFNSQGGSSVAPQTVREGYYSVKPADPTRSGYTFEGWYLDAECTYNAYYSFDYLLVTENFTLYAKWGIAVTGVSVSPATLSLKPDATQKLIVTITPANATNKNVTWTSSNENIAYVNAGGRIQPFSYGTVVLTVTTEDGGYTATCTLTISASGGNGDGGIDPIDPNTAVESQTERKLYVYPNPIVNGQLIMDNGQLKAGDKVEIYSMNGALVLTGYVSGGSSTTLNLSHLSQGTYVVKVGGRAAKVVKK
jgi:uncharacterized repeat protein (TIGR02543 family)